jgi:Na+-translocating ferredoxin:NAD+ oxidoreductase subunit B
MGSDVYQRLRRHVNEIGTGFPATTSGVELRLLRRLFTEEEAETYIHLTENLETPEQIAQRDGLDPERLAMILQNMAEKGLVFPKRAGAQRYYAAAPAFHGLYEHQVVRMDQELAQIMEEYVWAEKVPEAPPPGREVLAGFPLRTIPVETQIGVSRPIAPYEDVKEIIGKQDRIAVAKCFCTVQQQALGKHCNQPEEVCLLLGFYADYYVDLGLGRRITQEEALEVLNRSEEAGLVHQMPNSTDPAAICNCCPNCCGQLRFLKMLPNPAAFVTSDHFATVERELCTGCQLCVERCRFDAITMSAESLADVNRERCIGCGLCVSSCVVDAIVLAAKPAPERREPGFTTPFMRSSQDIESTMR